jgi:hypothetical protein
VVGIMKLVDYLEPWERELVDHMRKEIRKKQRDLAKDERLYQLFMDRARERRRTARGTGR